MFSHAPCNRNRSLITPVRLQTRLNDRILHLFTLVNIGSVRKRKANDLSITPGVSTSWFQSTDVSQIFFNHPSDYTIGSLSSQMLSTHRESPPMVTNRLQLITNHHQWHKWSPRTIIYLVLNGTFPIAYPSSCSCPFLPILMLYEYLFK